jgi:hypothetical protein
VNNVGNAMENSSILIGLEVDYSAVFWLFFFFFLRS